MKRFLLLLCFLVASGSVAAAEVTVFAAASLNDVLTELAQKYEKASGNHVRFSFAASSTLAKQIESGAPASLFISADEGWMDFIGVRGLTVPGTRRDLLGNRLVLVEPATAHDDIVLARGFDLAARLGANGRLAVGDPSNVPAGIYAREALTHLGMWDGLKSRLASTDSVRSALALVERAETPFGIVYSTDAVVSKGVRVAATFPDSSHQPITYPVAVLKAGDNPIARDFENFLESPSSAAVFQRYGFSTLTASR